MFTDNQMEWQTHYELVSADVQTARLLSRWLAGQLRALRARLSSTAVSTRSRLHAGRGELVRASWAAAENADPS